MRSNQPQYTRGVDCVMKVGDLVTMNNQNWTTTPFLVVEKSWVKNEWIIWSAETGTLQWHEKRLELFSESL